MHTNESLNDEMIMAFAKTIELFGLSKLESRLFAYLYLINKPQTLDEMSEALGKSKTAMSTSVRNLAELHLVSQVWMKGVRKDLYTANTKIFKEFMNFYFKKWVDKTERQKEILMDIQNQLAETRDPSKDKEEKERVIKRLDEIIEFHLWVEEAFNEMRKGKR